MTFPLANYIVCATCLTALLAVGASRLAALRPSVPSIKAVTVVLLLVAAMAARFALPPAFIHSNLHGFNLMNSILDFPRPSQFRAEFGQGSFLVLGLLSAIFGRNWDVIVVSNILFNVGILACASVIAFRLGGFVAAYTTIAMGMFWPPIALMAPTEDAYNSAVFFGMLAVALADGAVRSGAPDRRLLIAIAAAATLSFYSRQGMFFIPALAWLLLFPLRPWKRSPLGTLAAGIATVALYGGLAVSMGTTNDTLALSLLKDIIVSGKLSHLLLNHPILNPSESLPVLALGAVGVAVGIGAGKYTAICLASASALVAASSLGLSVFKVPQLEYGMRMPLWALVLPLAGFGASYLIMLLSRISRSPLVQQGIAFALVAACVVWPLQSYLSMRSDVNPQEQEYRIIQHNTAGIPADALRLPPTDNSFQPPYAPPLAAFGGRRTPIPRLGDQETGPVYVLAGLGCSSYSLEELLGEKRGDFASKPGAVLATGLFLRPGGESLDMLGISRPPVLRRGCAGVSRAAQRFIHWGDVTVHDDDLPFVYYSADKIPVGVWIITPPSRGK